MCIEWNDDWLIKYIYEHKNSNNMNEYRGFKVGDRVEITFSSAHPIKGTITSFGDRKLGGFAEPDTMDVWISETTRYDMIYLVSHDLIKKLPKYAVGDVVRRNNKQLIKCEITSVDQLCDKTHIYTLSDCGSARFSESMLITFDGFRVGDTVFTVKRGKGKIVADRESMPRRFKVVFDADKDHPTIICRHPKLTNLIPTEAKYKEALNKTGYAFKIDVAVVEEYDPKDSVAKHFEKIEKAAQAMNLIHSAAKIWANAFGRTTDQIKFPSGGVVFSGGTGVHGEYCEPFAKPLHTKKPTYTRTAEGHLELVDGMDGCEKKYCASKFGVGENVQYGCIKSDIVMIYWNGSEFLYTLKSNSAPDNIRERFLHETVKPSAKFKVGDAVYYKGVKTTIRALWRIEPHEFMYVIHPNSYECAVPESDLRLWVETKFSYILGSGVCIIPMSQIDMKSIKYMGKSVVPPANIEYGDDVFLGKTTSGKDIILFGTNGDDIS